MEALRTERELTTHHLEALIESAISEHTIRRRGYWSATETEELRGLGFADSQIRVPALVLPIHDVRGEHRFSRIRPDNPRPDPENPGKVIKYEQPFGTPVVLDVPRDVSAGGGLEDTSRALWICEGEKKADSLVSAGEEAVAVLGVWSWKRDDYLLGDFDHIRMIGREIIIAFDSDSAEKYEVLHAQHALGAVLKGRTGHAG